MYPIGSKVVHPAYGAGIIMWIQSKHIGGANHDYYVIALGGPHTTHLLVPVLRAETLGLRCAGTAVHLRQVLAACQPPEEGDIDRDFRTRQVSLRAELVSGSFAQVAAAVWILGYLNVQRHLGNTDRELYAQGKDILASELALATEQDIKAATVEIESLLDKMSPS